MTHRKHSFKPFKGFASNTIFVLIWIEKIYYHNGVKLQRLIFKVHNDVRGGKNENYVVKYLNLPNIIGIRTGQLYNQNGTVNRKSIRTIINGNLNLSINIDKWLKFESDARKSEEFFSTTDMGQIDMNGLMYFSKIIKWEAGRKLKLILPSTILFHYFFHQSSTFVDVLISKGLDVWIPNAPRIILADGEKVGILDVNIYKEDLRTFHHIAPLFFLKHCDMYDLLSKSRASFSNQLYYSFSKFKGKYLKSAYFNFPIKLSDSCEIIVSGNFRKNIDSTMNFLVTNILDCSIPSSEFLVDRVELHHAKNLRRETSITSENSLPISVWSKDSLRKDLPYTDELGNRTIDPIPLDTGISKIFTGGIPVIINSKHEDQERSSYIFQIDAESFTEETEDGVSGVPIAKIKTRKTPLDLSRTEIIERTLEYLKDNHNVIYLYRALNGYNCISNVSVFDHSEKTHSVIIAELDYLGRLYYLMKIDNGAVGFFHHKNYHRISSLDLEHICLKVIDTGNIISKKNKPWTALMNQNPFLKQDIIIGTSLFIQVTNFVEESKIIAHMARKIFNDRILPLSA